MSARLYDLLGLSVFPHDFERVRFEETNYNATLGLPGLHTVRPRIAFEARTTCLPPDIVGKYRDVNFWLNPKLNTRGAIIL